LPVTDHAGTQRALFMIITVLAAGFGIYTYNFLPVVDFLPYKEGNHLPALMRVPPGAPQDVYQITYTLKHKGSGEEKRMTDKEYLKTEIWKDAAWEIVGEPENKLISAGYQAPIRDLKITDSQGTDYTSEIVENPYYNLVVVAWNLPVADKKAMGDLNALAMNAAENYNIRTVILTSSSPEVAMSLAQSQKLVSELFYADAVPLKSMVRSNPGLMLLRDGTVVKKWHYHSVPSYDELDKEYFSKNQE
ncbi:MAG TPA: DoxX family protein, partial [Sphingobacteriaceae bacterium]